MRIPGAFAPQFPDCNAPIFHFGVQTGHQLTHDAATPVFLYHADRADAADLYRLPEHPDRVDTQCGKPDQTVSVKRQQMRRHDIGAPVKLRLKRAKIGAVVNLRTVFIDAKRKNAVCGIQDPVEIRRS